MNPFGWFRVLYCERRLRGALIDEQYYADEIERNTLNRGVARTRIEIWRRRLSNARYPIRGLPKGSVLR